MPKAVLTTTVIPTRDDLPEERYYFSRAYLNQVRQAVGDFICITNRVERREP